MTLKPVTKAGNINQKLSNAATVLKNRKSNILLQIFASNESDHIKYQQETPKEKKTFNTGRLFITGNKKHKCSQYTVLYL